MKKTIAFSGAHGTGKTTAALLLSGFLRKNGVNVGFVPSASEESFFLASGDKSLDMHLEVCALQIAKEMQAKRLYDVIICDRCIVDFYLYSLIRFGKDNNTVKKIQTICSEHITSYSKIIYLRTVYKITSEPIEADTYDRKMFDFYETLENSVPIERNYHMETFMNKI